MQQNASGRQEYDTEHPEYRGSLWEREFEFHSPAECGKHGLFMFEGRLWEYPAGGTWQEHHDGDRYSVTIEMCPGCESEMTDYMYIQDELSLSHEEMERGGDAIIAARDYARGFIDAAKYIDVLQNKIIPDVQRLS